MNAGQTGLGSGSDKRERKGDPICTADGKTTALPRDTFLRAAVGSEVLVGEAKLVGFPCC